MKKYFSLQLKRAFKLFPYVVLVTVVLLFGVFAALGGILQNTLNSEENTKVKVGVAGDMESSLLQLGLGAFKTIDDSKYSLELIEYEEAAAAEALKKGELAAYIIVPDDFIDKAFAGEVEVIRFVTTAETNDVVTMFKSEVLEVITRMVIASQKGTYGIGDVLYAMGQNDIAYEVQNDISMDYFELVIARNKLLKVDELGIGNSLTTTNYYICSILILFIMLMGLPYATLYCKSDNSLAALLSSKGMGSLKVLFCEYLAHLISLVLLTVLVLGGIAAADGFLELGIFAKGFGCPFLHILPSLIMLAAFNIMMFELSVDIISGLLGHFFVSISVCYISGCFFPLHTFPNAVQTVAKVLPVGLSREHFSSFFTGDSALLSALAVLGYAALFFGVSLAAKRIKLSSRKAGIV